MVQTPLPPPVTQTWFFADSKERPPTILVRHVCFHPWPVCHLADYLASLSGWKTHGANRLLIWRTMASAFTCSKLSRGGNCRGTERWRDSRSTTKQSYSVLIDLSRWLTYSPSRLETRWPVATSLTTTISFFRFLGLP